MITPGIGRVVVNNKANKRSKQFFFMSNRICFHDIRPLTIHLTADFFAMAYEKIHHDPMAIGFHKFCLVDLTLQPDLIKMPVNWYLLVKIQVELIQSLARNLLN